MDQITQQLVRDEGEVKQAGRHVAYEDHLGYLTIGHGRLIDKRRGGGITDDEAAYLLASDIKRVRNTLSVKLLWFGNLNDARQGALINMAFQLGINGLMLFKQSLSLLQNDRYDEAANEFLRSRWAEQTPERALRVTEQIRTGEWV